MATRNEKFVVVEISSRNGLRNLRDRMRRTRGSDEGMVTGGEEASSYTIICG